MLNENKVILCAGIHESFLVTVVGQVKTTIRKAGYGLGDWANVTRNGIILAFAYSLRNSVIEFSGFFSRPVREDAGILPLDQPVKQPLTGSW